jgi:dienelactone hydrolase
VDESALRAKLYSLLGDLPPRDRPISAELVSEEDRGGYVVEKLVMDLNGIEPVPALFARPKGCRGEAFANRPADVAKSDCECFAPTRRPTILYHHAHGGDYALGKRELIEGRPALQQPPYAEALTAMGMNVLCADTWLFGERSGRKESSLFKEMLWKGQVLWGMMVYDSIRAMDYLSSRPDVDGSRIGTMGMSMGSTMAWWLAALDDRVAACVDICCLTDFDALIDADGLDGHGLYYYVPGLLKEWSTGKINALIAPRPHLALAGDLDSLTPPKGLDRIDAELKQAYVEVGAPEAWKLSRYPVGHTETEGMRREALEWLGRWLNA